MAHGAPGEPGADQAEARRLVEAILDNVSFKQEDTPYQLHSRLLRAQQNVNSLKALLAPEESTEDRIFRILREISAETHTQVRAAFEASKEAS